MVIDAKFRKRCIGRPGAATTPLWSNWTRLLRAEESGQGRHGAHLGGLAQQREAVKILLDRGVKVNAG